MLDIAAFRSEIAQVEFSENNCKNGYVLQREAVMKLLADVLTEENWEVVSDETQNSGPGSRIGERMDTRQVWVSSDPKRLDANTISKTASRMTVVFNQGREANGNWQLLVENSGGNTGSVLAYFRESRG